MNKGYVLLKDAVEFFDGLTYNGLRLERDRGNLRTYRVAGKEYTTREDVEEMFRKCAVTPKARGSGSDQSGETKRAASHIEKSGSSETGGSSEAQALALEIAKGLKGHSRTILPLSAETPIDLPPYNGPR